MTKDIEEAVKKAKDLVEKMKLEEPYKSLTYAKLLQQQQDEAEAINRILLKIPNAIFVG